MAQDFDNFPVYDELVKDNTQKMSEVWINAMGNFIQNLGEYLSQFGMFVPKVTTAERDSIQQPENGQLIYNTSINKFQGRENGNWVNLI